MRQRTRIPEGVDPAVAARLVQYEVVGLPPRHIVWIGHGGPDVTRWRILRMFVHSGGGATKGDWTGNYESPEAALRAIQDEWGTWMAEEIGALIEQYRKGGSIEEFIEWDHLATLVPADRTLQLRALKYGVNARCKAQCASRFNEGFLTGSQQTKSTILEEFAKASRNAVIDGRPAVDVLRDIADQIDPRTMLDE